MSSVKLRRTHPHSFLLWGALSLAAIAISTAAPLFRAAAPTPPLVAAAARLSLAALCLSPWTLPPLIAALKDARRRRELIFLVLAGVSYAVHFGAWVCSLSLTSVAASVSLVTCTPLLLALVGWLSGQERLSWTSLSSLALACLGIFIMGVDQPSGVGLGEGLALLGAAAMAAYLLCARRLSGELSPLALTGSSALIAASILWSTAYLLNQPLMIEEAAIMPLIGTTLIPQLIGHSLLTWGLQFIQPTMVAFFTLAEPPLASLFTWIAFSERPSWEVFLGGGIVLFSVWRSQSGLCQVRS